MSPVSMIRSPADMRAKVEDLRRDGAQIAVVPTMGYLHAGHLSLIQRARASADVVITTLFVNPTQFGPGEDLDRYPRDEQGDVGKAEAAGTDLIFAPTTDAMVPAGYQTYVQVRELQKPLCGAGRPGHFDGVASVVTALFHITQPHLAVFGQKDYQQLALIRRMVRDLHFGVEIVGCPIVRETDGLAMSSRNAYLSPEQRTQATCLHRGLLAASHSLSAGQRGSQALIEAAGAVISAQPLAELEYLEVRDAESLETVEGVEQDAVMAVAARFGTTRLIDNHVLMPE